MSSRCTSEDSDLTGTDRATGSMSVRLIRSGSTSSLATVRLTGPGNFTKRTASTFFGGSLTFTGLPPGAYTVATTILDFNCPSVSAEVRAGQATAAIIFCTRTTSTTGAITGTVTSGFDPGSAIDGATVNLAGPASGAATTGPFGAFVFDELPPGTYTVAATDLGRDCQAVGADVQAARTTTVRISCTGRHFPIGSEIEGDWSYHRELRSQSGNCPAPLPAFGTGSMAFNSSNNTIEIVGLDPDLTIVGTYDKDSGFYIGNGSTMLGDGSSIQTDVTVTFWFDWWGYEFSSPTVFHTGAPPSSVWTRRHRDPSGNLVCTELYGAGGGRLN